MIQQEPKRHKFNPSGLNGIQCEDCFLLEKSDSHSTPPTPQESKECFGCNTLPENNPFHIHTCKEWINKNK